MKLCDLELQTCPRKMRRYKIFDGGGNGLYAEVPSTGSIRWRVRYSRKGKQKVISMGVYPEVSIDQARARAIQLRAELADGIDPMASRRLMQIETYPTIGYVPCKGPDPWAIIAELKKDLIRLITEINDARSKHRY